MLPAWLNRPSNHLKAERNTERHPPRHVILTTPVMAVFYRSSLAGSSAPL